MGDNGARVEDDRDLPGALAFCFLRLVGEIGWLVIGRMAGELLGRAVRIGPPPLAPLADRE